MKRTVAVMLALSGLLIGCEGGATGGMVTGADQDEALAAGPKVGHEAPDIHFSSFRGEKRAIRHKQGWVSIIGFVGTTGPKCCMLDPAMTNAAARYWDRPVRVIQVSLPTEDCPEGVGCIEGCQVRPLHLIALCDTEQQAYRAYGSPKQGTVVAVDTNGKIVDVAEVGRIETLYDDVDRLAKEAEDDNLPMSAEIYTSSY